MSRSSLEPDETPTYTTYGVSRHLPDIVFVMQRNLSVDQRRRASTGVCGSTEPHDMTTCSLYCDKAGPRDDLHAFAGKESAGPVVIRTSSQS